MIFFCFFKNEARLLFLFLFFGKKKKKKMQDTCIYLGGPIRGASEWRQNAVDLFCQHKKSTFCPVIMSPETTIRSSSPQIVLVGRSRRVNVEFEREWMRLAATYGALIFWLPAENNAEPRPDGDYARDTRYELGEWVARCHIASVTPAAQPVRLYIGMESGFPGSGVLEKNIRASLGGNFPIYRKLEALVTSVIQDLG